MRDKLLAGGLREDVAAIARSSVTHWLHARRLSIAGHRRRYRHAECRSAFFTRYYVRSRRSRSLRRRCLLLRSPPADPDVVGLNFVQPEDAYIAMSEYTRQMLMLDYLHSVYPAVHISLHAGELAPGMVPPAGCAFISGRRWSLGMLNASGMGWM